MVTLVPQQSIGLRFRNLPILFVCENNLYSVYSSLAVRQPRGRKIHEMVSGIGMKTTEDDGNDVEALYSCLSSAIEEIRKGGGPQFLELHTYRWREHCGPFYDNDLGYRTEEEFRTWKERDPIPNFQRKLVSRQWMSDSDCQRVNENVQEEVDRAFEFAETSSFPDPQETFGGLYRTSLESV